MQRRAGPWWKWTLLSLAWLLAAAGCGDDDDADRDHDVQSSSAFDASVVLDAGRFVRALDTGVGTDPPVLASAPASACTASALPSPVDLCDLPDPTEPNSYRAPARLTLEPTCASISALAADKDQDAYRFVAEKSDPVSIEVSYTTEHRTDLAIDVRDLEDRSVARVDDLRSGPSESIKKVIRAGAGSTYDVRVDGANVGLCQAYNLRVDAHYCSDEFEDNDTEGTATKLSFDGSGKQTLSATAHQDDQDFYEYTTAKADPVHITGSYTANLGDDIVLRRIIGPARGASAIDETGTRSGPMASFEHWMRSPAANTSFRIQIYPSGSGCAAYQLALDTAACTDVFEDNDEATSAAKLPLDQDLPATAFYEDPDYYDLSVLSRGGTCTVSYDVAAGTTQRLRADVYTATQGSIASSVGTGTTNKTIVLSWPAAPVTQLSITAEGDGVCQPYVLRCSEGAPAI
jgi:hypothetical protein